MNAEALFDNSPFNQQKVAILDEVTKAMHSGDGQKIGMAMQVLNRLSEDKTFWMKTKEIMEFSKIDETKFFSLMILQDTVKNVQDSMKGYIGEMIMIMARQENPPSNRNILTKANSILVEIIKKEWGTTWNTAISDLTASSGQHQNICMNNLQIIKMLSEEVFDFSKNQLTSTQVKELKTKFSEEFASIYKLCDQVIKTYVGNPQSIKISLVKSCLSTLHSFTDWMPNAYIFQTDLLENILLKLMDNQNFCVDCVKCLSEIASIDISGLEQKEQELIKQKILEAFNGFTQKIQVVIPRTKNLKMERQMLVASKNANRLAFFDGAVKAFISFFTNLFDTHFTWIVDFAMNAQHNHRLLVCQILKTSLHYMSIFSEIDEDEIFKLSIIFWELFLATYKIQCQERKKNRMATSSDQVLNLNGTSDVNKLNALRKFYGDFFSSEIKALIMNCLVEKMPKPQEVVFIIDESGLPKKIAVENTAHAEHHIKVKNCLTCLAKMNFENLQGVLNNHINMMMSFTDFNKLNSLCWAIGSISGTNKQSKEKRFVIQVLRNLLTLIDSLPKIENKSIVASNTMYIVCKYPRFLMSNIAFMMCVFNKIFEFMHNKFDGVREMAVNTFSKLCEECNSKLVQIKQEPDQMSGNPGFMNETWDILCTIPGKTKKLQLNQKIVFYEGIGHLLGDIKDDTVLTHCIQHTLTPLMTSWKTLIKNAENNTQYLTDPDTCMNISFFLRVNQRISETIGKRYQNVFDHIFKETLQLYNFYSEQISGMANGNNNGSDYFRFKRMRVVRQDILKLFSTFLKTAEPVIAYNSYFPGFGNMLSVYQKEDDSTKEPELLLLYSEILEKMHNEVGQDAKQLLNWILSCTLPMITKDFESYPDHRVNFFLFLRSAVKNCFQYLISIEAGQFKTMIDCLIWSIKHQLSTIYNIGLETILIMLSVRLKEIQFRCRGDFSSLFAINQSQEAANAFYKIHYMSFLYDTLTVLTDRLHVNGFELQKEILRTLLSALDIVTVPIYEGQNNNKLGVGKAMMESLSSSFANLSQADHEKCISNLFSTYGVSDRFETALRDYLILLNIFTNKDLA